MADRLTFRLLTPTREVLAKSVDSANLTAAEGELGILPGHAALLAELRPGEASCRDGDTTEYFALSEGFLEVNDDVVTALVRAAEPGNEIDVERAELRRKEREEELEQKDLGERQMKHAELSLRKQLVRLRVGGRSRGRA